MLFYYLAFVENNTDKNVNIMPASSPPPSQQQQRSILNVVDENSSKNEYQNRNKSRDVSSSPSIDEARTNISSSIGPATSTPSPSSPRHYKPVSLTSTQTYFKNIQEHGTSPILQVKRLTHEEYKDKESITILTRPRTTSMKHGEKKDIIATVRFTDDTSDDNESNIEETYL